MRLHLLSAAAAACVLSLPVPDASARCGKCGNATLIFVNKTGQSVRVMTVRKQKSRRGRPKPNAVAWDVSGTKFLIESKPVVLSKKLSKRLCSNKGFELFAQVSGLHKYQRKGNDALWRSEGLDFKGGAQFGISDAVVTAGPVYNATRSQGHCNSTYTFTIEKLNQKGDYN